MRENEDAVPHGAQQSNHTLADREAKKKAHDDSVVDADNENAGAAD
jgi:hypothetical protein